MEGPTKMKAHSKVGALQFLVVLVGLPGAGKTFFAELLEKTGWVSISQDDLGDRGKCVSKTKWALNQGHNIVIDRCNVSPQQRSHWVKCAMQYKNKKKGNMNRHLVIIAVCLQTNKILCQTRVAERENHLTLKGGSREETDPIVDKFDKEMIYPTSNEKFDKIVPVASEDEERLKEVFFGLTETEPVCHQLMTHKICTIVAMFCAKQKQARVSAIVTVLHAATRHKIAALTKKAAKYRRKSQRLQEACYEFGREDTVQQTSDDDEY